MSTERDDLTKKFGPSDLGLGAPRPKIRTNLPKTFNALNDFDFSNLKFELADPHEYDSQPEKMGMIFFPGKMPVDTIAAMLILMDATIMVPINGSFPDIPPADHHVFLAKLADINNLLKNWKENDNIKQSPLADKIYEALDSSSEEYGIGAIPLNDTKQKSILAIKEDLQKNRKQSLIFLTNNRDKINFLYTLCADNIRNIQTNESLVIHEQVFKEYILQQIYRLEHAKANADQLFEHIMSNLMISDKDLDYKINQFKKVLGQTKFSQPLSMPVVLDDGTRADLFQLDKSKPHKIMHSVDISKINEHIDLSNFIINGDFICARAKTPIVFPKQINGCLDCSYWDNKVPTSTIRIPNGATTVNFTGVIKSFKDLINIDFPNSVNEVLLLNSTLTLVSKDKSELQAFEDFTAKHPEIQVWDSKHNTWLQDTLIQEPVKQNAKPVVSIVTVVPKSKPTIEEKTEDWLTRKEIVALLQQEFAGMDVERLVKLATKTTYNNVQTENKLVDGTSVLCIHKNYLPNVIQNIHEIIKADSKRASQPQQTKTEDKEPVAKTTKAKKQKPLKIEKFIPQKVWNDIKDSCNDSANLIYSVLEHISKVNVDFTKEKVVAGPVKYIDKNGQIQVVPTLHIEDICAITQSIGNRYIGKRIIWTMNPRDKILVAIRFMETHADNSYDATEYKETRKYASKIQTVDGENITRDLVVENGYLNVADLLEQYKPKTEDKNFEPKSKKTTQKTVTARVPEPAPKPAPKTASKLEPQRVKRGLADMKSVDAKVKAFIKKLDAEIAEKSATLDAYKNDIDSQETIAQEILKCIEYKKSLLRGLSK